MNVNEWSLYRPEQSTIDTLFYLILGITDARIAVPQVDAITSLLHKALPRGTTIIPFCNFKPFSAFHRNTTMGWQLILIDRQLEKWAGLLGLSSSGRSATHLSPFDIVIIRVMVPPKLPVPHTMWQRLSQYLERTKYQLRPDENVPSDS